MCEFKGIVRFTIVRSQLIVWETYTNLIIQFCFIVYINDIHMLDIYSLIKPFIIYIIYIFIYLLYIYMYIWPYYMYKPAYC